MEVFKQVQDYRKIFLYIIKICYISYMKKAYIKAIEVINSCENSSQVMSAYNYIHNFRVLFGNNSGCDKLAKKLMEKCAIQRKRVGNI